MMNWFLPIVQIQKEAFQKLQTTLCAPQMAVKARKLITQRP